MESSSGWSFGGRKKGSTAAARLAVPASGTTHADAQDAIDEAEKLLRGWLEDKNEFDIAIKYTDGSTDGSLATAAAAAPVRRPKEAVPELDYDTKRLIRKMIREAPTVSAKDLDTGMGAVVYDPLTAMDLRHQMVREKKAARERERERQQRDRIVEQEVKKTLEKEIAEKRRQQDLADRAEEARIRAEMAAARRQLDEERARRRKELEASGVLAPASSRGSAKSYKPTASSQRHEAAVASAVAKARAEGEPTGDAPAPSHVTAHHEEKPGSKRAAAEGAEAGGAEGSAGSRVGAMQRRAADLAAEKLRQARRDATRAELSRQLQIASEAEAADELKLKRRCFASWRGIVLEKAARVRRFRALWDCRRLLRVWSAWVSLAREGALQRDAERAVHVVAETRRKERAADEFVRRKVLLRAFLVWRSHVRAEKDRRREAEAEALKRAKMQQLLAAAREGRIEAPVVAHDAPAPERDVRSHAGAQRWPAATGTIAPSAGVRKKTTAVTATPVDEAAEEARRAERVKLRSEVEREERKQRVEALFAAAREGKVSKMPTVPVDLKGMDERARIAKQKKEEKEQRQREKEADKMRILKELEAQKEAEIQAEKEAELQRKREEKRQAAEREKERQARLAEAARLNAMADAHYRRAQLRYRGLEPWIKMVEKARADNLKAYNHNRKRALRNAIRAWAAEAKRPRLEMEAKADAFRRRKLMLPAYGAWKKFVANEHRRLTRLDRVAHLHYLRRFFGAWWGITRKRLDAEKEWSRSRERVADDFFARRLKLKALRAWHVITPVAREDRIKEERKSRFRSRVAAWLPDYEPPANE